MPYSAQKMLYSAQKRMYSEQEKLESKQKGARSRTVQQAEYTILRGGRRGARDAVCRSMIHYFNVPNIDEPQISSLPTSTKHSTVVPLNSLLFNFSRNINLHREKKD
jgi:hypothetical protein